MKKNSRNTFYLLLSLIAILCIGVVFGEKALLFVMGLVISVVVAISIVAIFLIVYVLAYTIKESIDEKRGPK